MLQLEAAPGVDDGLDLELRGGRRVTVRLVRPADADLLRTFDGELCERSRRLRYLGSVPPLTEGQALRLATVDGRDRSALVAFDGPRMIADCRLDPADRAGHAELAVAVADDFQGAGLGTAMTELMLSVAGGHGLEAVVAEVRDDNQPMMRVLGKLGFRRTGRESGTVTYVRPTGLSPAPPPRFVAVR